MQTLRLKKLVVLVWILVGVAQVTTAALDRNWLFLALGVVYLLLGVAYFWFEVYRVEA